MTRKKVVKGLKPEKRYVQLQLPDEVVDKLRISAAAGRRTLPAEVTMRLESSINSPPDITEMWFGTAQPARRYNHALSLVFGMLANKVSAVAGDLGKPEAKAMYLSLLKAAISRYLDQIGATDAAVPKEFRALADRFADELLDIQKQTRKSMMVKAKDVAPGTGKRKPDDVIAEAMSAQQLEFALRLWAIEETLSGGTTSTEAIL